METPADKAVEKEAMVCEAAQEECEEACRECEEAIRECEEAALSCRYLLSVCVIIIILLGSLLIYLNLPYDEEKGKDVKVYYIMPKGCTDCDLKMIEKPAKTIGVDVEVVESDAFKKAMILVVSENKTDYTSANSELNFLGILCDFAQIDDACALFNESQDISLATACVEKYNVSLDTVFFYTQDGCDHCADMASWIRELKKEGYEFYTIDLDDEEKTKIADECLFKILDLSGDIPQFACASNGKGMPRAFTSIEEMKAFADDCASA